MAFGWGCARLLLRRLRLRGELGTAPQGTANTVCGPVTGTVVQSGRIDAVHVHLGPHPAAPHPCAHRTD
ncbi:hypothetical protein FOF52_06900 [Thermobifida alba]|uniref:Uncharacterized protein n=1 Tax=Thermobifida alba TaxID=53522 RepID=A0ABY4L330_THEAE|nr:MULTISPECIES: hypothetical protein [Thermobifida]UPT20718.1 hypothetical protein FOF52_06900 [Thermobifida alba]HLU97612.1 hypothetical protein [Thermobifida alba]